MNKYMLSIVIIFSLITLSCCSFTDKTASVSQSDLPKQTSYQDYDKKSYGWGMGKQLNEDNCPLSCISFQEKFGSKYDAYFYNPPKENSDKKTIMLTFDNGYENGCTEKILDILKEKDVHAVFFLTGDFLTKNDAIIRRMVDENHTLGNHTVHHPSMPEISVDKMISEIQTLDDAVSQTYGVKMNLFRPPKGEYSEQSLAVTKDLGYKSVFWSFAYADWDPNKQPNEETSKKSLIDHLHNGAIYLLHAVSKTNTNILADFIDSAKSQGYEFVTEL
ncbi:MAG: polysaccharide deacetylase family protein [Oscillospiraceae bacterium]|nr:polysaccharide deacetylase family protein [Oscillospiraceae bacterium]